MCLRWDDVISSRFELSLGPHCSWSWCWRGSKWALRKELQVTLGAPYNGRGRLGLLPWSEAWSHLGTIDLDGHSGKRRELKDLFGPYLGYKWINLFVQGLLEDLCYFTLLFLLEQKDNWDVDLSFEELLIALTYASQCQCCPEEEIRSSCVLSLSGRHILLIVFLILNLIYFLSNFVSSTVCLHKESPSAHIAVGRSFDCAFYEIGMSLFEALT